jgi:hypothetical protein
MHKYNILSINTQEITNVRDATSPTDAAHPLARTSIGMVEGKLLAAKVRTLGSACASACTLALIIDVGW